MSMQDDDGSTGGADSAPRWSTGFLSEAPADTLAAAADDGRERFSVFIEDHLARAVAITGEFSAVAAADPTLVAVQALAEHLEPSEPLGLVQHALMMFITHDPAGRAMGIPSLEARKPDTAAPSKSVAELQAATDQEALLDWFREDPKANEHHEHWHVVFPGQGDRFGQLKDRHGELFYYMHRQMLARYNAERLAVFGSALGTVDAKVRPLEDYRLPLEGGYNPGFPLNQGFTPRPAGLTLQDVTFPGGFTYTVTEHERVREALLTAARTGRFVDGTTVTSDLLGATAEGSAGSVDNGEYVSHHNLGHMLISSLGDGAGVMRSTETAIRDPAFWRWHRHVDDIWWEFQQTQTPNDFADAPAITAQAPTLVYESDVDLSDPGASAGTDELTTAMFTRIVPSNQFDAGLVIAYLDQRPFGYVLRLDNPGAATEVTARVFIAPAEDTDDSRAWIEMDKFKVEVEPGPNTFYRSASESSVVKKAAIKPPQVEVDPAGDPTDTSDYCSCGWPYNLLLPRGTRDGSAYELLVIYTDAAIDDVIADRTCGSVSFCGVMDDLYPDTRPMGYPFDRPFAGPLLDTFDGLATAARSSFTIRWIDPWGSDAAAPVT
ncbi:MAG: tyrosinase family protein [Actinomycetota bacterium]